MSIPANNISRFASGIIFAAVAFSTACAGDDKPRHATAGSKANAAGQTGATFDLRIVGPDGKPVPDAKVNLSTSPPFDKQVQLRAGSILNRPRFGINFGSDADGRVEVELPAHLQFLNFRIHKPGYGYYWSASTKPEVAQKPLTVKLERAWTIGGVIVDAGGKPIPNARILLTIRWAGSRKMGLADRLWSNSQGVWKFESVPESMDGVAAEISEPRFTRANPWLGRAEFEIKPGHEPTAKITLETGPAITGKITDETGNPIAKALVRTRVGNDTRSATTGEDGVYRLEGCNPGNVRLVATAKGRVAELQEVKIGPRTQAVDFRLKPGHTLRIRVLDEQGRPAPRSRIDFLGPGTFDEFQFDRAPRETDRDGIWEWNEAPADELIASISRPNGMTVVNRRVVSRKEEYVFRVPSALVVSGKVIDADTRQPVKTYRAVRGFRWYGPQTNWDTNNKITPTNGTYEMREYFEQSAYLVWIEADGYLHAVSREIKCDEGNVTIDFELIKGQEIAATVLTPDGAPAAGARVAVVAPNEGIVINQGEVSDRRGRQAVEETDAKGRFQVAAKTDDFWLVVTHPSGYAVLMGLPTSNPHAIPLLPWARIEGTFQLIRKPQPDVEITLNNAMFFMRNAPPVVQDSKATDLQGRFVFDRVMPGKRRVTATRLSGRGDSETTSSTSVAVDCSPGKTTHVDLGTAGRPVTGQLRPPKSPSEVPLSSVQIIVRAEGKAFDPETDRAFDATPDRQGNFCIDDLPPGNYFLNAQVPGTRRLRIQRHRFTVPKVDEKLSQRPIDLGVLTLDAGKRP